MFGLTKPMKPNRGRDLPTTKCSLGRESSSRSCPPALPLAAAAVPRPQAFVPEFLAYDVVQKRKRLLVPRGQDDQVGLVRAAVVEPHSDAAVVDADHLRLMEGFYRAQTPLPVDPHPEPSARRPPLRRAVEVPHRRVVLVDDVVKSQISTYPAHTTVSPLTASHNELAVASSPSSATRPWTTIDIVVSNAATDPASAVHCHAVCNVPRAETPPAPRCSHRSLAVACLFAFRRRAPLKLLRFARRAMIAQEREIMLRATYFILIALLLFYLDLKWLNRRSSVSQRKYPPRAPMVRQFF